MTLPAVHRASDREIGGALPETEPASKRPVRWMFGRRRVLAGVSAGAAAAVTGSSAKPDAYAAASGSINIKRSSGCFSARDAGVRGDGEHDDTEALQAAIDSSEVVFLPPGIYRVSRALRLRSNRHIYGAGAATIIRNDQTSAKPDERCAFLLGDHHPAAFRRDSKPEWCYPNLPIEPVREADNAVTLVDRRSIDALRQGNFVWVRSVEELNYGEWVNPYYLQLTKVRSIDRSNGVVYLADPIDFSLSNALLTPLKAFDPYLAQPYFVVENVVLENMDIEGHSWGGMRYCAYRCTIRDLGMRDVQHLVAGNCLAYCILENIYGSFAQRFLEIKNGSSWSIFRNIRGYYKNPLEQVVSRPWETGERSYGLTFEYCHLTLDRGYPGNLPAIELKTTATALVRCVLRDAREGGRNIVIHIPSSRGPANERIALDGIEVLASGPRAYLLVGSNGAKEEYTAPSLVTLRGSGFRDASGKGQRVVVQGGARLNLVGNEFADGEIVADGGQVILGENFGIRQRSPKAIN